jgi:N-acetylneuraminic acid mutarotase
MATERSHCGGASAGGKLFAFGGGGPEFKSLQSVETYDPEADRWTFTQPMPTLRSGLVAVTLHGRIYVMGGGFRNPDGTFRFLTVVELFNPVDHSWEAGPSLLARHDAPSATGWKDHIYLFGGHHPEAQGGPLTDPAFSCSEKLEPGEKAWVEITPLPTPRFSSGCAPFNGKIWVMGGGAFSKDQFRNFDLIEIFDPDCGEWLPNSGEKLPWPSAGVSACNLNGKVYVFGGNDGSRISNRSAVFDPDNGKWEELAPMPEPRAAAATAVLDGTIYLIGGRDASGKSPTGSLLAYHPA